MRGRMVGIQWLLFAILTLGLTPPALSGSMKGDSPPGSVSLSLKYLWNSMQGYSGAALDINGDGNDDLVIGAPYERSFMSLFYRALGGEIDHWGDTLGAVLVYFGGPEGFSGRPSDFLMGSGNFGWSVAALRPVNGTGKRHFAVGAVNGTGLNASLSGTVTIYEAGVSQREVAVLEGENALDRFGYALASGDLNGDGAADLIVGAPLHSPSPDLYQQGAVYVYFGPVYQSEKALKIPSTPSSAGVGFSLATGDINGDGQDDLLVGASGKVLCYHGGASFPSGDPDVVFSSRDTGFGRAIAVIWDVDHDGFRDVAVGAHQAVIGNAPETGRLFILKGGLENRQVNADEPDSAQVWARIDGEPNSGQFASSIVPARDASGNDLLAVGAVHADGNPWPMTGKIYLFSGDSLAPGVTVASAVNIPGNSRDMHLGAFLATVEGDWGKRLVAGAPSDGSNTGSVWLFDLQ